MKIINIIIFSLLAIIFLETAPTQYIFDSDFNKIQIIFLFIIKFLVLYKYRKHGFFVIFSVFLMNVLITLAIPAFNPSIRISGIGSYYYPEFYSEVLQQFTAFYIVLFGTMLCWNIKTINNNLSEIIDTYSENRNNYWVVIVSIFAFLTFILFAKVGRQTGEVLLNLPIEYSYIFIFLIKIYGNNTFINKLVIHILLISLMFKTLIYGGRIELIIAAFILYILYYERKISYRLVAPIAILGVIFFELTAIIRSIIFSDETSLVNNRLFLLFGRENQILVLSNEGDVIYSGMAMVGIIESNIVSISTRVELFLDFLITQFLPIGGTLQSISLAHFIQQLTPIGGGGIIFSQFYFWLGNLGVILCSLLIMGLFWILLSSAKGLVPMLALFSIILFPRWYIYFPDYLIKIPMLYCYGMIVFYLINVLTKRRNIVSKIK